MIQIPVEAVNQLMEKIRDSLLQLDPSPEADQLNEIFKLMIARVQRMRDNPPEGSDKAVFAGLAC